MTNYAPSFPVARLYRKQSASGRTYFTGRWGGARVALLKSQQTADDGSEIWNLVLAEAPARKDQDAGQRPQPTSQARDWQAPEQQKPNSYAEAKSGRSFDKPLDDKIPF